MLCEVGHCVVVVCSLSWEENWETRHLRVCLDYDFKLQEGREEEERNLIVQIKER